MKNTLIRPHYHDCRYAPKGPKEIFLVPHSTALGGQVPWFPPMTAMSSWPMPKEQSRRESSGGMRGAGVSEKLKEMKSGSADEEKRMGAKEVGM